MYVLRKFLGKHYGDDKAVLLIKKYSNNLDGLAKSLGEKDITFFNLYFLSEIFVPQDGNVARTLSKSVEEAPYGNVNRKKEIRILKYNS